LIQNNVNTSSKREFIKPKKDFSFLTKSKYVKKWIDSYNIEKQKRIRLLILEQFCNFIEKTPDELILEHQKDRSQLNPLDITDTAKNQLHSFYSYLIGETNNINKKINSKPISKNSARQYVYSKLAGLFKRNNVAITFQKGEVPKSEAKGVREKTWRNATKIILREERKQYITDIRDMFENLRDKTILLCKKGSGMDDVDLFNLKIKDFLNGYLEQYSIAYIHGNRKKVDVYFQTFFDSEACNMLKLYLKERNIEINTEINKKTLNDWLFISYKDKNRKIKETAFADNLRKVCEKLGLKNITAKSFRHWFSSEIGKITEFEVKERMMGHKIEIAGSYAQMLENAKEGNIQEFAEYYIEKIEPILLLGNGNRKITKLDREIEKIKIENEALKDKLTDLTKTVKGMSKFVLGLAQSVKQDLDQPYSEEDYSFTLKEVLDIEKLVKKLGK